MEKKPRQIELSKGLRFNTPKPIQCDDTPLEIKETEVKDGNQQQQAQTSTPTNYAKKDYRLSYGFVDPSSIRSFSKLEIVRNEEGKLDITKIKTKVKDKMQEQPRHMKTIAMGGSVCDSILRCLCNIISLTVFVIFGFYVSEQYRYGKGLTDCFILQVVPEEKNIPKEMYE